MINVENNRPSEARREAVREEGQAQRRDAEQFAERLAADFASRPPPSPSQRNDIRRQLATQFPLLPANDAEALLQHHFPNTETTRPGNPDLARAQPTQAEISSQTTPPDSQVNRPPAQEAAAQSNTARQQDTGPPRTAQDTDNRDTFKQAAVSVARDGATKPNSPGRPPPPTAVAQSQAARPQVTTTHPSATAKPAAPTAQTASAEPQHPVPPGVPSRETPPRKADAPIVQSPVRVVPPRTAAKGTTGTAPSGETSAAPEATPLTGALQTPEEPPRPGVKIFCRTDGRQDAEVCEHAREVEVKFSVLCRPPSETRSTAAAGAAGLAKTQSPGEENDGETRGTNEREEGVRSTSSSTTRVTKLSGRWRDQGSMRG